MSRQLFLGDRFAGESEKCDQNVERTAAEAQRLAVLEQHPPRRDHRNDPKMKVSSSMAAAFSQPWISDSDR